MLFYSHKKCEFFLVFFPVVDVPLRFICFYLFFSGLFGPSFWIFYKTLWWVHLSSQLKKSAAENFFSKFLAIKLQFSDFSEDTGKFFEPCLYSQNGIFVLFALIDGAPSIRAAFIDFVFEEKFRLFSSTKLKFSNFFEKD